MEISETAKFLERIWSVLLYHYDESGTFLRAWAWTLRLYSALFFTYIENASDWAGLCGLGLINRSWIPKDKQYARGWKNEKRGLVPVKISFIVKPGLQSSPKILKQTRPKRKERWSCRIGADHQNRYLDETTAVQRHIKGAKERHKTVIYKRILPWRDIPQKNIIVNCKFHPPNHCSPVREYQLPILINLKNYLHFVTAWQWILRADHVSNSFFPPLIEQLRWSSSPRSLVWNLAR